MKRLLGVGATLLLAGVANATTWMVTFDRLNDQSLAVAQTYMPSVGYNPSTTFAAAAGAIDATGKWNVFNPDTRGGNVFNGTSGAYGGNYFDGAANYGTGSGIELYDTTGTKSAIWTVSGDGSSGGMWLPRYDVDLTSDLGKLRGPATGDGKAIGGNDGARTYAITLGGLTAGETFNLYMFGWSGNIGANWADNVSLNLNGGTPVTWNNTGAYSTRGGLVSGIVQGNGKVTINVSDDHMGFFASGIVFKSGAGDPPADVPEPGTWLLLGGSLLGLCAGGFRRFVRK